MGVITSRSWTFEWEKARLSWIGWEARAGVQSQHVQSWDWEGSEKPPREGGGEISGAWKAPA